MKIFATLSLLASVSAFAPQPFATRVSTRLFNYGKYDDQVSNLYVLFLPKIFTFYALNAEFRIFIFCFSYGITTRRKTFTLTGIPVHHAALRISILSRLVSFNCFFPTNFNAKCPLIKILSVAKLSRGKFPGCLWSVPWRVLLQGPYAW